MLHGKHTAPQVVEGQSLVKFIISVCSKKPHCLHMVFIAW